MHYGEKVIIKTPHSNRVIHRWSAPIDVASRITVQSSSRGDHLRGKIACISFCQCLTVSVCVFYQKTETETDEKWRLSAGLLYTVHKLPFR